MDFSQARINYNNEFRGKEVLPKSLCTVDGTFVENISIKDVNGNPNEEYYKWEFIYSLISSGKIPSRDYIGAEIYFPKGNIHSAPIKIDSVIFSDIVWIDYYRNYRANPKDVDSLKKVRELAIGVIEYKRNDKSIEQVFSSQIRASIKEPENPFVLGIYYDTGRLFLFKKIKDEITRFDNSLSFPNSQKILEQYQLEITDPYYSIPSLDNIVKILRNPSKNDRSSMHIEDLDIVYTIQDDNMKNALNSIMRVLDSVSLSNEEGYMILIQLIAMKIYDESNNVMHELIAPKEVKISRIREIESLSPNNYKELKIQNTNEEYLSFFLKDVPFERGIEPGSTAYVEKSNQIFLRNSCIDNIRFSNDKEKYIYLNPNNWKNICCM